MSKTRPRHYLVPEGFFTSSAIPSRIARAPDFDPLEYRPAPLPRLPFMPAVRASLTSLADGRNWYPDALDPFRPVSSRRRPVRLVSPTRPSRPGRRPPNLFRSRPVLAFSAPRHVVVCVRRRRRREVLHALRIAGRGGRRGRRYRRNAYSDVRC